MKASLFLPGAPLQDLLHRRLEVVVGDPVRHAAEVVKGLDMAFEEGFLLLRREGHHEQLPRIAQAHVEDLDRDPLAGDLDHGLAPVGLRIRGRVELQRDVHLRPALLPPPLGDVAPHRRLTALVAGLPQFLADEVARIALLGRQFLVFSQQFVDPALVPDPGSVLAEAP